MKSRTFILCTLLCTAMAGCGAAPDSSEQLRGAGGKDDAGDALDYSIEVATDDDGNLLFDAEGNQQLRVTLVNSAWSARYVSNCGITLNRMMPGAPEDDGFIPPWASPAGYHPEPLTEAEYPRFCIDDDNPGPKRLKWTFARIEDKSISFLIPMPAVPWWYQINIPYGRSADNLDDAVIRALTIPLYDYEKKQPQVVIDSSIWPTDGAVQLRENDSWVLSGTLRNTPQDHYHLVIEASLSSATDTEPNVSRKVYTIDPQLEVIKAEDQPSELFEVVLNRAYANWLTFELIARHAPGASATVYVEASGPHAGIRNAHHGTPTVTSNAWQVRFVGAHHGGH